MDDIKPCPFCGSIDIRAYYDYEDARYIVQCRECYAIGPTSPLDDGQRPAIARWNRRAVILAEGQKDER